jgi:hypothetical protein
MKQCLRDVHCTDGSTGDIDDHRHGDSFMDRPNANCEQAVLSIGLYER